MSRRVTLTLAVTQVFIGLNGIAGGAAMVADPSGASLWMTTDALAASPFPDYLVPGLVLLCVNGIGSLIGSVFSFRARPLAGYAAIVLGSFLILWILAQVWWLGLIHWLQPLFLVFGLLEFLLGLLLIGALRGDRR